MVNQFYKRLDNFWDQIASSERKHQYLLRVSAHFMMFDAQVCITSLEGGAVRVRIVSQSRIELFTDGMLASIREDICRLVRHLFSECNVVTGEYVFARHTSKLSWYVYQELTREA